MKFVLLSLCFILTTLHLTAQPDGKDKCFIIDMYLFCPGAKTIEQISFNYETTHLLTYNYDSTRLYVFGNKVLINDPTVLDFLKDNSGAKIRTVDMEKLHVYSVQNNNSGYNRDVMLAYDDNDYYAVTGKDIGMLSKLEPGDHIKNSVRLSPFVMKNKGKTYALIGNWAYIDLIEIPQHTDIDIPSFKLVADEINTSRTAFYTDKNGLYVFSDKERFTLGRIADSEGKDIAPIVAPTHVIYGDKVFSRGISFSKNSADISLSLDVNNMKVYSNITRHQPSITILNDEKTAYVFSNDDGRHLAAYEDSAFASIGQLLSKGDILFYKDEERPRNLYFTNGIDKEGIEFETIVRIDTSYRTVTGVGEMYRSTQVQNVYIYNEKDGKYEPLDYTQYRYISDGFFVYKNTLYNTLCKLEDNLKGLDATKVNQFVDNNIQTRFITDGKNLIYGTGYTYQKPIASSFLEPKLIEGTVHIYKDVDMESLRAISPSLIRDKNNFYYAHSSGLEIIQITELGLPVVDIEIKE